tara:strand:- start:8 stop:166 length:159 start_codon:yes stop_codon:yes gene_type:complete
MHPIDAEVIVNRMFVILIEIGFDLSQGPDILHSVFRAEILTGTRQVPSTGQN